MEIEFAPRGRSEHKFAVNKIAEGITQQRLLELIDQEFTEYLPQFSQENRAVGASEADHAIEQSYFIEFWNTAINNHRLSELILATFPAEDLNQVLKPRTLLELLDKYAWIDQYLDHSTIDLEQEELSHGVIIPKYTPLEAVLCKEFGLEPQAIPCGGQGLLAAFFNNHMRDKIFFADNGDSQQIKENMAIWQTRRDFTDGMQYLLFLLAICEEQSNFRTLNIHNIGLLLKTRIENSRLKNFSTQLEEFHVKLEERFGTFPITEKVLGAKFNTTSSLIHELLKQHFPDIVLEQVDSPLCRLAVVTDFFEERKILYIELVPPDNFFFTPDPVSEVAPEDANYLASINTQMIRSRNDLVCDLRDISVFDACGNKLFWGDLSISRDLKRLNGPLYILSRSDSYTQVPQWSILKTGQVQSTDRQREVLGLGDRLVDDKLILTFEYIRLKALAKIVAGKLIENPKFT